MSHFAFIAPAYPSHYSALAAIAHILIERGHKVTFFHQADAAGLLKDPRIGFVALGAMTHPPGSLDKSLRRAASPGGPLGLKRVIDDLAQTTDMLCRDLPRALEIAGVDALVCDQMEAAGGLVAEAMGLPYVSVACALPVNREPGIPLPVMPWAYSQESGAERLYETSTRIYDLFMGSHRRVIERHSRAFGIPLRGALHECLSPLAQISQTVQAFDFPRRSLPAEFHHVGPLRSSRPEKGFDIPISPNRPFVFASLGTLQGQRYGVFRRIAEACERLDAQLLIAHCGGLSQNQAEALRRAGKVWMIDFAPQQAVLARADAVVSHAGLNTVMDAFVAGTPILALPIAFDQPGVASRVVYSGAGLKAAIRLSTAKQLCARLDQVISEPSYRGNAQRLGDDVRLAGGAGRAAEIVESVVCSEPAVALGAAV
jgi:zeaxanthin glucosyltransferase